MRHLNSCRHSPLPFAPSPGSLEKGNAAGIRIFHSYPAWKGTEAHLICILFCRCFVGNCPLAYSRQEFDDRRCEGTAQASSTFKGS